MIDRTKRAFLNCSSCRKKTLHDFSHEQEVIEKIKKDLEDVSIDLWYKCEDCFSLRRWGQEHIGTRART